MIRRLAVSKLKLLKILKSLKKLKLAKIERCNFNKLLIFEALLVETIVALVFFVFLLSATSLNKSVPYSSLLKDIPPPPPPEVIQGDVKGEVLGVSYSASATSINVGWSSTANATGYGVRWAKSSEWPKNIRDSGTLPTSYLSYKITGLASSTPYHIQVLVMYPGSPPYNVGIVGEVNASTLAPAPTPTPRPTVAPRPTSTPAPRPTSTPVPTVCRGPITIDVSPNPANPGSSVAVYARGLSGCGSRQLQVTTVLVVGSNQDRRTCTITGSNSGCFRTYTAPSTRSSVWVAADLDGDGGFSEPGGE